MAEKMSPCPFCDHSGPFDQWPCEWLDATEANVVRCPMCHGAAPAATWNRRHLAKPAQAVDVGAIREVIVELRDKAEVPALIRAQSLAEKLTRAIGNAQAEGWSMPEGCIPVPRSIVERWASVDAFNAPVGAAMELKTVAAQMLIHADMITAPPQPEE